MMMLGARCRCPHSHDGVRDPQATCETPATMSRAAAPLQLPLVNSADREDSRRLPIRNAFVPVLLLSVCLNGRWHLSSSLAARYLSQHRCSRAAPSRPRPSVLGINDPRREVGEPEQPADFRGRVAAEPAAQAQAPGGRTSVRRLRCQLRLDLRFARSPGGGTPGSRPCPPARGLSTADSESGQPPWQPAGHRRRDGAGSHRRRPGRHWPAGQPAQWARGHQHRE